MAAERHFVKIRFGLVRKMLRIGVRTGLLVAVLFALMKLVRSRRSTADDEWAAAGPHSWPPVQDHVAVEPPAPVVTERTAPLQRSAARKAPAKKAAAKKAPAKRTTAPPPAPKIGRTTWVEPTGRICPPSHPVKAKLSSRIFHLPGMAAYNRTVADRCYTNEYAAEDDGFTKSKR